MNCKMRIQRNAEIFIVPSKHVISIFKKKKKELCKIFFWNDKRNTIKITIWKNIYIYNLELYDDSKLESFLVE